MTLKIRQVTYGDWEVEEPEAQDMLMAHRPDTENYHVVIWNGHQFEVAVARYRTYPEAKSTIVIIKDEAEFRGSIYYPTDPRTIAADWHGCQKAKPNADGTAWLPDWDKDTMIDYEEELQDAAIARFQNRIDGAQIKINESTNSVVRSQTIATHRSLVGFRNDVVAAVVEWCQNLHIGWQEQNPHEAHLHLPILNAINATALDWQTNHAVEYGRISGTVAGIIKDLSKPHAYETRWDKAARLAAEAKAAAAAAETEGE